jgi:hypothetical protein
VAEHARPMEPSMVLRPGLISRVLIFPLQHILIPTRHSEAFTAYPTDIELTQFITS